MEPRDTFPNRRDVLTATLVSAALVHAQPQESCAEETRREVFLERAAEGTPHKGKVLLAVQAHSDDIPLMAGGNGRQAGQGRLHRLPSAGHERRHGRCPGPGNARQHRRPRPRQRARQRRSRPRARAEKAFDLNYANHRMGDVPLNELICRLIFLIRLLKVDTVVCWDPWAHDEENPDHVQIARGMEAACWMAGRAHDYPEQLAAGLDAPRGPGKVLLRPAAGGESRRGRERRGRSDHRRQPREPGERAGRKSRLAAAGRTGQARPKAAAPRRQRPHRRPQLHQRVHPDPPPRLGEKHGVEYAEAFHYRRRCAPLAHGRLHQEERRPAQVTRGLPRGARSFSDAEPAALPVARDRST